MLPARNRKDLEEIDPVLRNSLSFHFVEEVDDGDTTRGHGPYRDDDPAHVCCDGVCQLPDMCSSSSSSEDTDGCNGTIYNNQTACLTDFFCQVAGTPPTTPRRSARRARTRTRV